MYNASIEAMSAKDREEYTNRRLIEIIHYAYQNAPAVRQKMDKAGVNPSQIRTVKDLEKIPITKKDEFTTLQKQSPPFGGFLGIPNESLEKIFISPGPIYEPQDAEEVIESGSKALYAAGFRKGDRVIVTLNYNMSPAGQRTDQNLNKLGAVAIPTGVGNTELQVQIMKDLRVTGYVGTPSFLMTLVKRAEELGYHFHDDFVLRHAWTMGEMLPPSIRKSLEQDYGIIVRQGYGTAELGLLGYECHQRSGMHIPEEMIIEIVDPQTKKQLRPGEIGEVVATPFNKIYPLIRFSTGDLSSINSELCPCGRTSNRLTGILGRVGEEVKVRGMFIHPRQVEEVIAKFAQISNFQAVVGRTEGRDKLTINLEIKGEEVDRRKLTDDLAKIFQDICRVRADDIRFVAEGTIPSGRQIILDERRWE
jgi:phenylacetate-CoA ligase